MQQDRKILLSFDVEEFDLPLEYQQPIAEEEQLATGHKGLLEVRELLSIRAPRTTLFTTAFFAEHFQDEIRYLSNSHEISSHTYYHSSFREEDLKNSRERLEFISQKPVFGLRMPRMKTIPAELVSKAGYQYNSSINPTWIPGRYNHLRSPRKPYLENNLVQFPVAVTPFFRVPLFWLTFKNVSYSLFLRMALKTLKRDGHICLYFHPWEFIDLSKYKIPAYLKRGSNRDLSLKLVKLIDDLSGEGNFTTMHEFINSRVSSWPNKK